MSHLQYRLEILLEFWLGFQGAYKLVCLCPKTRTARVVDISHSLNMTKFGILPEFMDCHADFVGSQWRRGREFYAEIQSKNAKIQSKKPKIHTKKPRIQIKKRQKIQSKISNLQIKFKLKNQEFKPKKHQKNSKQNQILQIKFKPNNTKNSS